MLLLLLAIAWLAVVIVIVAACQAAARGDAQRACPELDSPELMHAGLLALDGSAVEELRARDRPSRLRSAARTGALRRVQLGPGRRHFSRGIR